MKLLVSDYDDTFFIDENGIKNNIEIIKKFRKNNLFVIATGRNYNSIKKEQEKYGFEYDYLIINHGATIIKDGEIIYNRYIDRKSLELLNLRLSYCTSINCYDGIEDSVENITKIMLCYNNIDIAQEIADYINDNMPKLKAYLFPNYNSVEIISNDVDKLSAIKIIADMELTKDVYVIGDNINDYDMIKYYNGFCTKKAIPKIKEIAKKEYDNVSDLIMELEGKMNLNIFRAYDIRGIYNEDITDETAYILGKSFGSYVSLMGKKEVLVGYDNRLSSPNLQKNLIKGLLETGIDVISLGMVTTPMYYFARERLNKWSAIMITASHNPSNYNGFKMSFNENGNAVGDEIADFRDFTLSGNFKSGNGTLRQYNIKEEYINYLVATLKIEKNIKLVIDCGNGTCSLVIKDILDKLNVTYDLLYCDSDPTFPHHHPDPSISENLVDLQKRVLELHYDLGIAVDADGDRVRLIDEKGNIINTDVYMIVVYRYLNSVLKQRKGLFDVKCSKALKDELLKLDIEPIMYKTGNSYMYRKCRELKLDFAGEYAGHVWYGDRFLGIDDGIYAGLRMVEIMSRTNKKLSELTAGINHYYSTDELKIKTTEENKYIVVEKCKNYAIDKKYIFNDIDGIRVEFPDSWALIRVSNTGPYLTVRFEAITKERLDSIQKEFMSIINSLI